jgi:hypothetical protein
MMMSGESTITVAQHPPLTMPAATSSSNAASNGGLNSENGKPQHQFPFGLPRLQALIAAIDKWDTELLLPRPTSTNV